MQAAVGEAAFTDPAFAEYWVRLNELKERGCWNADINSLDYQQGMDQFVQGKAAMIFGNDTFLAILQTYFARYKYGSWGGYGGGTGGTNGEINALAFGSNKLYISGAFTNVAGVSVTNIAMWDGRTWSPVGALAPAVVGAVA